jgi:hypothetical protein
VLARPGVLEDLSSAYDSEDRWTDADDWVQLIADQTWLSGDAIDQFVGDGPLITDDRPLPEYFLLRRLGQRDETPATPATLVSLAGG